MSQRSRRLVLVLSINFALSSAATLTGCGSAASPGAAVSGGRTGQPDAALDSGAASSGGAVGSGGAASGGRSGSGGESTGGSGSGGAATGGAAASGGAAGGATASGGAGGSAAGGRGGGSAGAGGTGRGGAAGAATMGGGSDGRAAAQVLDGFTILKPCVSSFRPSGNASNSGDCCCEEQAANENQHLTRQFGGDAGVTYNVKVRVAGVAERYWYSGGMLDSASGVFYTGGLPTIHSTSAPNNNLRAGQGACKVHPPETDNQFSLPFTVPPEIKPADGCYNGFNIFAMTVSSPKQSYYLNYTTDYDRIDRQPHSVYKTDYTVTISITGQARLDFYTIDGDHHQVTNNGTMTVPNLKTAQPYNGNFLEFTVLEVTRAN